jgi:hypothetical protein
MYNYTGHLEMYFETGISFPMIYVDHPNTDPWKKTFVLEKATKLQIRIIHPKNKNIVYDGTWTYSRSNTAKNDYIASPEEIESSLWKEYLFQQYRVEFTSNTPVEADLCSFIPSYNIDIWELKDNNKILIAHDAKIFKIVQKQKLVVDKSPKRWVSTSDVQSFQINSDGISLKTETEFFIIKKAEKPIL